MNRVNFIALAGRAGSGKDAVATLLVDIIELEGCFVTRERFAEPIKDMIESGLGIDCTNVRRGEKETPVEWIGKSRRELMQTLGTEWGRNLVHPDIWVRALEQRLRFAWDDDWVVIPDCRFRNEVEWIQRRDGQIWWVERDGVAPVRAHSSEQDIGPQDCTRTIANLGTLEELAVTVQRAWAQMMAEREAD